MVPNARWRMLDSLFAEAVELDAKRRAAFLDEHCGSDLELRAELESLLRSADTAPEFLDRPIMDAVRRVAEQPSPTLRPGGRVAQYLILNLLGVGGMGQVYTAQDTRLQRKVALKVLSPHLTQDAQALQRFEHEARTASALNHPNILTIFEIGEADGLHFIVSEFVQGQTLRLRLGDALPVPVALDIASQVASALVSAHDGGIIHRDVKPENIVIRPDGLVKLLDFGIAKLAETNALRNAFGAAMTDPGMVVGTPKYMSPEQARGIKVDARTDIFSLGAILYEMITGKEPFEGETSSDIIAGILKSDPPALTGPVAGEFPELQGILHKAMQKNREVRYQTSAELLDDLLQLKRENEFRNRAQRNSGSNQASVATDSPIPVALQDNRKKHVGRSPVLRIFDSWLMKTALLIALLAVIWAGVQLLRKPGSTSRANQPQTLAILPFRNLKPDQATDFLGFSLADAMITKLAYVHSLNVRPSSSVDKYRNQSIDPRRVAADLRVDNLLTGSYVKDGDDLRISTQLIDARANRIIWQDTMDLNYD